MTDQRGGTIPFMAPEQITNYRDTSPAADHQLTANYLKFDKAEEWA